jgi:hypothetical protein
VIYEPFDYAVGDLHLQSGTSEIGLLGSWSAHSGERPTTVVETSLAYGALPLCGGSIGKLDFGVNRFGGARSVSASALASTGLLASGATLWFSLEMGYGRDGAGNPANTLNARLAFALANSSFAPGNYQYWITKDGLQPGSGLGVTLGYIDAVPGRIVATQFRDVASGDFIDGNVFGDFTGTTYGNDQHGLIVGKIVWGDASDTISLYQPDTAMNLGAPISKLTVSVDQSQYDTITFARSDPVVMDELRFGASYEAVIGASAQP